jgi:hypothetical protein
MGFFARIARKCRTAASLRPRDWLALAEAWAAVGAAAAAIRLRPLPRLLRDAADANAAPAPRPAADPRPEIDRLLRLVRIAARYRLRPAACLPRSLALRWMLRRRGIPAALEIGVRKDGGRLRAHAWLVYDGAPIGEPEEVAAEFVPLLGPEARS